MHAATYCTHNSHLRMHTHKNRYTNICIYLLNDKQIALTWFELQVVRCVLFARRQPMQMYILRRCAKKSALNKQTKLEDLHTQTCTQNRQSIRKRDSAEHNTKNATTQRM